MGKVKLGDKDLSKITVEELEKLGVEPLSKVLCEQSERKRRSTIDKRKAQSKNLDHFKRALREEEGHKIPDCMAQVEELDKEALAERAEDLVNRWKGKGYEAMIPFKEAVSQWKS